MVINLYWVAAAIVAYLASCIVLSLTPLARWQAEYKDARLAMHRFSVADRVWVFRENRKNRHSVTIP